MNTKPVASEVIAHPRKGTELQLTINQTGLAELLKRTIPAGLPVLVTGAPGVGKTDIITHTAVHLGYDVIVSHPQLNDPSDVKGLAWYNQSTNRAEFIPLGEINTLINCTRPTIWFIEDLGNAPPAIQSSYMQWILASKCGEHSLPACVTIISASNRRQDRSGVSGLLASVRSRFVSIVDLSVDNEAWCNWAVSNELNERVITFLRSIKPNLLSTDEPISGEICNFPSPRTWANVSKLEALNLPRDIMTQAFAGAVGVGAATEYMLYRDEAESCIKIDDILANPKGTPLPDQRKPSHAYTVSTGLALRTNYHNYSQVIAYMQKWYDAGFLEYVALWAQDVARRERANAPSDGLNVYMHPEFNKSMISLGVKEAIEGK